MAPTNDGNTRGRAAEFARDVAGNKGERHSDHRRGDGGQQADHRVLAILAR
jgi:hypothetical protein